MLYKKIIIGVMGPGKTASKKDIEYAYKIGKLIAMNGWTILSGGRNTGVMDAVNKGAKNGNGLTIGIMPTDDKNTFSKFVDIPIITNMHSGRNYINILSSNVIIACGMNSGTASEISLAIQTNKPVILLNNDSESIDFFKKISNSKVYVVKTPEDAIKTIKKILYKLNFKR